MGSEVGSRSYTREQRQRHREKVREDLDVLERMLTSDLFELDRPLTGLEIELNLIDDRYDPAFTNVEALEAIADPGFQTELARYNIELNVPPRPLDGDAALELEADLRASLNAADAAARTVGSRIVAVGILPTLMPEHLSGEWISANNRYAALNESIFVARGEDVHLDITGPTGERVSRYCESIAPESACTSVQLHLQVPPDRFADTWNAAQALAAPQVALAANSPFLFGARLHDETRVELFGQATDTRPVELRNQGVRPRVFFGDRWVTSIFDLFEENVRFFPALLAETSQEDPAAVFDSGTAPALAELVLHNGTVYRWNRPIYAVVDGRAHLRIENRVLPAGPTVVDVLANAAFYYGALRTLADQDRPVWTRMSFAAAEQNFAASHHRGIGTQVYWPGLGHVGVDELVLRHLLPQADEGLRRWGVSTKVRDRYLSVIEERAARGVNGATWQVAAVAAFESQGQDRPTALRHMLAAYVEHMHTNEPVHTWPVP